jgi:N-acetyl-anhydromuramyl-L-alanine amidase AmpD
VLSPLATSASRLAVGHGRRPSLHGLVVHTTGSGIVDQADAAHADPLDHAVHYYADAPYHPHYVCGWDGRLVAVCDEELIAYHVGLDPKRGDVQLLGAGGGWAELVARPDLWRRRWHSHGVTAPTQLMTFAGRVSANAHFVGIELLPLRPRDRTGPLWFTDAQHARVAELVADLWARHGIAPSPRAVLGHEDLNPLDRFDGGGGWDPGALRERPRFDWSRIPGAAP